MIKVKMDIHSLPLDLIDATDKGRLTGIAKGVLGYY